MLRQWLGAWFRKCRQGAVFAAAIALVAAPADVSGQEVTAAIRGRVHDADGRALAGVSVSAQSPSLIQQLNTATTADGDYVLPPLAPGNYVIGFTREGLVPVKRTMRLSAGESVVAHVVMRPERGDGGAVTVVHERLEFPPSEATSLDSGVALQQLPVTGARRSVFAVTTGPPHLRASAGAFLFDGMPLEEGWRLTPEAEAFAGPGPEAIHELTVLPGRLPVPFGRLEKGALALVTASGGSRMSGSFRIDAGGAGLDADLLRTSRRLAGPAATAEYTVGGPIRTGSTWFFASGRHLAESVEDDTAFTDVSFDTTVRERFGIGRLTHRWADAHRVEVQWVGAHQRRSNAPPSGALRVADVRALESRIGEDRAWSASYVGVLARLWQVSARYTHEDGSTRISAAAADGSRIDATRIIDQQTGVSAWASGGCLACEPRRGIHHTLHATAGRLVSGRAGSHHVTLGVEVARETVQPHAAPPGGRFDLYATRLDTSGGSVTPVFAPGGSSWIAWSPMADSRLRVASDAVFVSDRWSPMPSLSLDLGLRYDRARGVLVADDRLVLIERGFSPRVSATWRPLALHPWTLNAGFARYTTGVVGRGLDASFAAVPPRRAFLYDGPPINVTGPGVSTSDAIAGVLGWFDATGGVTRPSWFATDPGISTLAEDSRASPRVDEWTAGLSRLLGEDGYARADLTWARDRQLAVRRVRPGSAALDRFGSPIDVGELTTDDALERRYWALSLTADYRFGHWADVGARYTLSSLRGNADAAVLSADLPASAVLAYPDFFEAEWHQPVGALPDDARHRSRVWMHSELMANEAHGTLMLSLLFSTESGRPYGASGVVGLAPFVQAAGYQQPPVAARYFFTARDAFRTPAMRRADLGISYTRRLPGTVHGEIFGRFAVLNLMGQRRIRHPEQLAVVRTAFTDASLQPFDPFRDTPVRDVHWTFDDANVRRGTASESLATTMGRAVSVSLGLRF